MREVRVELHEPRVAALKRVAVAVNEAAPVAARARPTEHGEARVRAEQFFGVSSSPVRRVVVNEHHIRAGRDLQKLRDERGHVLALVVGRHDDERAVCVHYQISVFSPPPVPEN